MSYSLVIPCYQNFEQLRALVADIAMMTKRYTPEKIVVVNDGGDPMIAAASKLLRSELLPPIETVNLNQQMGPLVAFQEGLRRVETEYAILLHSDTRLTHDNEPITSREFSGQLMGKPRRESRRGQMLNLQYKINLIEDPLSVLYFKLMKTHDAFAVTCYGLGIEYSNGIVMGDRALRPGTGTPYTVAGPSSDMEKPQGRFFSELWWIADTEKRLFGASQYQWRRIYSCDTHAVALRMEDYQSVGFNHGYRPYLYFFDDLCGILRLKGRHLYLTLDTVVYHPETRNHPVGSFAKPSIDDYKKGAELFRTRWNQNPIWTAELGLVRRQVDLSPQTGRLL